jgi:hypothetical protein
MIKTNKMNYNKTVADFTKPTIITAQQYGTKVSVEIDHSDTDIDEIFDAFQTLIVGLGYHESSWKSWILDRADEYREEDSENEFEDLERASLTDFAKWSENDKNIFFDGLINSIEPNSELKEAAKDFELKVRKNNRGI